MERRSTVVYCSVIVLCAALTGCSAGDTVTAPSDAASGSRPAVASPAAACFAPIPDRAGAYASVSCDDPTAEAGELERVTATLLQDGKYLPQCPDLYDFALDVDTVPAVRVTSSSNRRFACVRRLHPPHATDPGQGRAPIVVGDCVYAVDSTIAGLQHIFEMPCSEAAAHVPGYRVFQMDSGITCPTDRTDLTFSIGALGSDPTKLAVTACAEHL